MERYTTVTFGSYCDRDQAERLRDTLRAALANSFLQPCEVGAAPAGGSFEVFLTTRYVFMDDDGTDLGPEANEKRLADHMLYVLASELVR